MFSRASRAAGRAAARKTSGAFNRSAAEVTHSYAKSKSGVVLTLAAGAATGTLLTVGVASASDDALHAPHYPWSHKGFFSAFDSASLRRGFEVYRQICATCHSMDLIAYRNLVGVTHTTAQAKAIAGSVEVKDGPNEQGEYFMRPGILADKMVRPYPNDEYARFINGGALPPDLSLMKKARHDGEDYIFALLTGFREPPAGVVVREGLHYNPYFPGGAIAMAKPLNDGGMEYEDGTPATESQMAKDVATFLSWTAEPEHDERKKSGVKWMVALVAMTLLTGYYKRLRWNVLKTRKFQYRL